MNKLNNIKNYFNKDIKEFNKIKLSLLCITILVGAGLFSFYLTNSYALFTDVVEGEKTITVAPLTNSADDLISKVGTSGLTAVTHEAYSEHQIGDTETITEYRFMGGDDVVTNNYLIFNAEEYRIIGVIPTDDGNGNIENRIKIIKSDILNYNEDYEDSESTYPQNWGDNNNWGVPSAINTTLNETYWGSITDEYKAFVSDAKYYLGGYNTAERLSDAFWSYERMKSGSNYFYGTNPTSWTGKIALMNISDYGYAASESCRDSYELFNYSNCSNNNWLFSGITEWTLTPYSTGQYYVYYILDGGGVEYNGYVLTSKYGVRPVMYLNHNVMFKSGDGSKDNPYRLAEPKKSYSFTAVYAYTAEEGMTWRQFVNSIYNNKIPRFYICGNNVCREAAGSNVVSTNSAWVKASDLITASTSYSIPHSGGSND